MVPVDLIGRDVEEEWGVLEVVGDSAFVFVAFGAGRVRGFSCVCNFQLELEVSLLVGDVMRAHSRPVSGAHDVHDAWHRVCKTS